MATFDGWEAQLYGPNTLAHFRTKGSKNGVRRFQMEDGTWTPLGLRERKVREGWGGEGKARRAEKKAARAERKAASAAARKERIAAYNEEKRKNNPRNMTEEELRKKIEHIKLEQEYKELTRSPVLKFGATAVQGYLKYRENKAAAEAAQAEQKRKDKQLAINATNAKAALMKAKAEKKAATDNIIDNLTFGAKRKNAKAAVQKAKTERSKNTIRGAISASLGNIIRKVGARTVSGMSDTTLASRGKAKVKSLFEKIQDKSDRQINDMAKRMRMGERKPWYGSVWDGNPEPSSITGSPGKKAKALAKAIKGWNLEDRSTYQTSGKKYSSGYTYEEPSGSGWTSSGYRRNSLTAAEQNRHNMNANRYKSRKRRR